MVQGASKQSIYLSGYSGTLLFEAITNLFNSKKAYWVQGILRRIKGMI
jgi:hypothetical protein